MQTKFTGATAKNLEAGEKVILHYAANFTPGYPGKLGLRVSVKGLKTWFIQYRLPGSAVGKKFSIGQFPALAFKDAKQVAADMLKDIAEGGDPRRKKQEAMKDVTLSELFDVYYKKHAVPNKKATAAAWDKAAFENHVKDILGGVKAKKIKRRDIISLLDDLGERYPVTRNRVQALLSMVFNVGIDRELVDTNPAFRMKKIKETSRDRVLEPAEIKSLWEQWDKVRMGNLFKFKLLTAQRDQEVRSMRWDAIEDGVWTIPESDTKNGKAHAVPLSQQAQKLLATIPVRGDHVFFAAKGKTGHVVSTAKSFRECRIAAKLPEDVCGHDLRRTAATNMGDFGFTDEEIGYVLNHSSKSVTTIYNRSQNLDKKRSVLQKWADMLDRIIGVETKKKVIQLRKQA